MTTSLGWLLIVLAGSFTKTVFGGQNCEDPDRLVVCHVETTLHPATDPCYCTHLVIHKPHDAEVLKAAEKLREKNHRLKILSLAVDGKKGLPQGDLSGVYLRLSKSLSKEQVVKNVKTLATELDNLQSSKRANAKYTSESTEDSSKDIAEILLELPASPEQLAKNYDLKSLNKYVNYFIITSDNLTDSSEEGMAYHPSRLMGIDDILNADSLVDLISGLGAEHEKLIISLPATALKFNLKDPKDNMPRAKVTALPEAITQQELCSFIENGVWTLERDEDLTAPYAYSNTTWLAFDDSVSAAIKAKYILLRGLAGISVTKSEADDWSHSCASRPILDTIYSTFTNLVRKPRAATLLSLQDQIHNSITPFAGDVQLSPFRIVRVVDRAGSIHVVRKEAKTEFQCSRQGYFTHPSGCNRFYRCVKFNQYSSDFTVFEYDCPSGLAFDERYEVCVWPGSLPDASACKGSSEIAPVPRSRYACSAEGYFADPENCRWFFACLDHHGDGSAPTAYEFRCPFGLVFNERTLTCDWPWSVPGCGSGSVVHSSAIYPGDILEGRLRPAYAQVSDVHVSGGRIANVDGGLVLGTNLLSGISTSGQRYSTGYNIGLPNQINSAFEDNSGAYIHDPTGDTGGEYIHQEGPNGPGASYSAGKGTSYASLSGVTSGSSGQYVQDSREHTGGHYVHTGGLSGSSSYITSSGGQDGQDATGGISFYGTGSSETDNSGGYLHDSRGDTGGAYIHQEGPGGPSSRPYLSSGSSSVFSGSVGSVSSAGQGNGYEHDSRGDTGGAYVHQEGLDGPGSRPYLSSGSSSVFSGSVGSVSSAGQGNGYEHDSRGDTGGAYVHQEGLDGPGSRPYLSSGSSSVFSGSLGSVSSAGQANGYVHDSRGDTGGAYIHQEGPDGPGSRPYLSSGSSSIFSGSLGSVSSVGQANGYVHDSRGDTGGAYIHQEGPGGPGSRPYHSSGSSSVFSGSVGSVSSAGQANVNAHDSSGETGGQYIHEIETNGPGLVAYSGTKTAGIDYSGLSGTKLGVGLHQSELNNGQAVFGSKTVNTLSSGTYIHDSRGDTGGSYVHHEGPSGPGSVPYTHQVEAHTDHGISGGSATGGGYISHYVGGQNLVGIEGYTGGSYSSGSASGQYIHHSAGDTGAAYIHQERPSYYSGIYAHRYSGDYIHDNSGAYVHDTTGDKAVPYIHQEGPSGPSGPIYHDLNINNIYNSQYAGQYASKYTTDHHNYVSSYGNGNIAGAQLYQPQTGVIHTYDSSRLNVQPLGYIKSNIKPLHQTVFTAQNVSPIRISQFSGAPLNPVQYISPISSNQQISVTTPSPAIQTEIKSQNIHPITVTKQPAVPFNPVQYVSTLSYQSPTIKTQTVSPLTVSSTPAVSSFQSLSGVKTHVVQPFQVSTPSPIIHYETPIIRTQTVRPITVTSSPVVPLNPIKYEQPISVLKTVSPAYESYGVSSISPPVIKTQSLHSVKISQPVIHTQDISLNYPQVAVTTPATPIASYDFKAAIGSARPFTVTSAPVIPLNPVQYGQKTITSTVFDGYDYPKPKLNFNYPQHIVKTQPILEAKPVVSYSYHPSVSVSSVVNQPVIKTNLVSPAVVSSTPRPQFINYEPVIKTQTVKPITVTSSPVVPLSPVQYGTKIQTIAVSTPAPPIIDNHFYNPVIKTQTVQPIIVSSTPSVPLNPVQYGVKTISSAVGYQYSKPIVGLTYPKDTVYSTQAPPVISYTYQKPLIKTQPIQPIALSTPAPPVVSYSYQKPYKPAVPITYVSTPAPPVVNYSYKQPIQPIIVSSTPAVPLNPVQYVKHVSYSRPAPPVIEYTYKQPLKPVAPISFSTPAPPVVSYSYQQPIKPAAPITYVSTPAPPVVNYSYKQPIQPIIVSSTPAVPLNPVQYVKHTSYSTPAPPVVDYTYKQPLKPVAPISFSKPSPPVVSYSYQQPIKPAAPITYVSTPAPPVVNYSYKQPIQPIIVSSTPAVPLNPVQYVKHISYSTPAPPVVDYTYKQPLKPVAPISFSKPSPPVVSYSYQQPIKPAVPITYVSTPAPPVVNYSYKQPIQPIIVSSTPAVPLNPVQYVKHISYSTPAPPVVDYTYKRPLKPVAPISFSKSSPPVVSYSYQQPIKPAAPITYVSTPAPPVINYSYKHPTVPVSTPAPPVINYSYQPLKPVPFSISTPAPAVSYSVKTKPLQQLSISSTPVVPLNPVQYVKPSTPFVDYSYHAPLKPIVPVSVSTPAPPVINYSYQRPLKPAPFSFSTSSPPVVSYSVKTQPELHLTISSTPAPPLNPVQYVKPARPLVDYSYEAPLKPVQYYNKPVTVSTPAPPVVNYEYKHPVKPISPVAFTTSVPPSVDYTYNKPVEQYAVNKASNVVFSYSFEAKPIQPISVSSTPVVPLNPVQYSVKPSLSYLPASTYSTPAVPVVNYSYRRPTIKPITITNQPTVVTTSAPKLSYSYQEEPDFFIKTKTVRPIAVSSTPVVPLNPVQYISTTPRPVINYKFQNPVIKAHASVVSPPAVDYYDEEILHRDIVKIPPKPVVSSFYEVPTRTTTLAPITVTSTPIVPFNPVQYVKQSLPSFSYKYEQPQVATYNTKGCCSSPSIKVSTQPDILKTPVTPPTIISSSRRPVVGAYFEENYEANRHEQGYVYSRPNIKFEERPFVKQNIYTTLSPIAIPAEVTTSTHLQRPVQTYANTVEEESYISNTPEHVATFVKQPISVDASDEDLNLHLDIPKIGVSRPVYTTTSTPQQQIVEVTTVTPVVKRVKVTGGLTRGGYYVRRQKVKVQPVVTTTENYPAYFTSTIKPIYSSTIDLTSPTLYSTTVRPSTVYTSSTSQDNELELEDDDDDKLLAQVSGQFGEIINAGNQGIIRQGVSSTTVSSLKDGEAIIGVVKKERVEGGRKKAKVVVVSKLSDFNPLLVGKLGAECSCKSNSKTLNLQRGSSRTRGQLFYPQATDVPIPSRGYLPSSSDTPKVNDYYLPSSEVPLSDAITSTTIASASYEDEPFVEIKPIKKVQRLYSTTGSAEIDSGEYDITTKRSIIKNRIGVSQEKTLSKGASFDRYGPGGLRGSDETLQGSVDCQRPGLFRHPKYCNKFYACNWDQWKKRFTLHVFNCPIHLAYDSQLGACNWPSKGPACADDNLLV